jgi:hypothetical protein
MLVIPSIVQASGARVPYVFLLLMHVTNLEPDILLGEWCGRRVDNVVEALQAMLT